MCDVRAACVYRHLRWRYTWQFATDYRGKDITQVVMQKKKTVGRIIANSELEKSELVTFRCTLYKISGIDSFDNRPLIFLSCVK
jgi:hypothetical protein